MWTAASTNNDDDDETTATTRITKTTMMAMTMMTVARTMVNDGTVNDDDADVDATLGRMKAARLMRKWARAENLTDAFWKCFDNRRCWNGFAARARRRHARGPHGMIRQGSRL